MLALPGVAFTLLFGAWHYGLTSFKPMFVVVMLLSVFSMAGVGVAMAVYSPHQQVTNAFTQFLIFYVLFFSPVLVPKTQLPSVLAHIAKAMPTTYSADAVRATITDLPGTHLGQSLTFMAVYAVAFAGALFVRHPAPGVAHPGLLHAVPTRRKAPRMSPRGFLELLRRQCIVSLLSIR